MPAASPHPVRRHVPHRPRHHGGAGALLVGMTASAALLLPLAGCGEDRTAVSDPAVVDSAGVEIVTSGGEDRPLAVELVADYRLGGKDDDVESFYQVSGYSVAVSDEGLIAVLDRDNHRVVVFDSDGEHVRTMGREGEGPGELTWPVGLFWTIDGEVMVHDIARHGLVGYDRDGDPVEGPALPEGFRGGQVHEDGSGLVLAVSSADPPEQRLVRLDDAGATQSLAVTPRPPTGAIELKSCGMSFSGMPPLFAPTLRWAPGSDAVAVVGGADYAVDVYRGGSRVRSVRRSVPPRPADLDLAVAEVGDGMRVTTAGGERVCDSEEVAEQRGFADVIPAVQTLAMGPDGTLWVGRWSVGDEPLVIDLFDPDGAYRGTLPPETPFPVGFLPDGRMLWSETDELEVQRLVVGRMAVTGGSDGSVE